MQPAHLATGTIDAMRRTAPTIALIFVSSICHAVSPAEWAGIEFPINIGATLPYVKTKLRIYEPPREETQRYEGDRVSSYEFKEYGVGIDFDVNQQVTSIWLSKGYNGKLGLIKIGDNLNKVLQIHGKPTKTMTGYFTQVNADKIAKLKKDEVIKLSNEHTKETLIYSAESDRSVTALRLR